MKITTVIKSSNSENPLGSTLNRKPTDSQRSRSAGKSHLKFRSPRISYKHLWHFSSPLLHHLHLKLVIQNFSENSSVLEVRGFPYRCIHHHWHFPFQSMILFHSILTFLKSPPGPVGGARPSCKCNFINSSNFIFLFLSTLLPTVQALEVLF